MKIPPVTNGKSRLKSNLLDKGVQILVPSQKRFSIRKIQGNSAIANISTSIASAMESDFNGIHLFLADKFLKYSLFGGKTLLCKIIKKANAPPVRSAINPANRPDKPLNEEKPGGFLHYFFDNRQIIKILLFTFHGNSLKVL